MIFQSSIASGTGLGAVSPEEDGRGGAGGGKRYRATGGSMEGAAETLGYQAGSSMMNYFFPSVVGMKKTSAVTEKVGESSPAAAEGPGPVQHKTRRLVSTATEPETPADETMEEERRWSSGDASEDHLEDPEWRGSGSETACLDIDDTSETSSLRAYGAVPDGMEQSNRSIFFYVLCKRAERYDPVACGMLNDRAVALDPVDVLYKVKGVREWYRGRLETNSEPLHSDTWKITFWVSDGSLVTEAFVEELLRIVKQAVFRMIRVGGAHGRSRKVSGHVLLRPVHRAVGSNGSACVRAGLHA